jgi:hypothetical protein
MKIQISILLISPSTNSCDIVDQVNSVVGGADSLAGEFAGGEINQEIWAPSAWEYW